MSRVAKITQVSDAILTSPTYPACCINEVSMYDEQIMSMPDMMKGMSSVSNVERRISGTYFFFVFNMENYYHFLYDTLPYLDDYFTVKKDIPSCKLLLPANHKWLPFQREVFDLLGISETELAYAQEGIYETLIVSSSKTHGKLEDGSWASNMPPSPVLVWRQLQTVNDIYRGPKKVYISRRSWIHGDMSNIGTNYTTRRRCLNEDEVVRILEEHGYTEVFCETMSMKEKIAMFQAATHVVGFIGGGLANLLFSSQDTVVGCIVTPDFLRINQRFRHSMDHTHITYLNSTHLADHEGPFPLYTRVRIPDGRTGEIAAFVDGLYEVQLPKEKVAGFSLHGDFQHVMFDPQHLTPLDGGLNSPFVCDVHRLREWLESKSSETK
jgi:hypothetical protein